MRATEFAKAQLAGVDTHTDADLGASIAEDLVNAASLVWQRLLSSRAARTACLA